MMGQMKKLRRKKMMLMIRRRMHWSLTHLGKEI